MTAVYILAAWALLIFTVLKIYGGIQKMNEQYDKDYAEYLRESRRRERERNRHHPTQPDNSKLATRNPKP